MSAQQAINDYCKGCIYDPEDTGGGSWRQQVTDCTIPECELYNYRPLTKAGMDERKEARLARFTPAQRAKAEENRRKASIRMSKQFSSKNDSQQPTLKE